MDIQEAEALNAELSNTFAMLQECCGAPEVLAYFIGLARRYFTKGKPKKSHEALIVGVSFPEELLRANSLRPHWVIGGSLANGQLIDVRVPRDANAITRSIFGYIERYLPEKDKKTPILIPIIGDNERKLAYLLQEEGRNVLAVDIAPEIPQEKLYHAIAEQLSVIMGDLTVLWHIPGASGCIQQAAADTARARAALREALAAPCLRRRGMVRMFLLNTYFYAGDLREWERHLKELVSSLSAQEAEDGPGKQGVLIVGSPVLFPNYKVPQLLENAGLSVLGSCDSLSGKLLADTPPLKASRRSGLVYELTRRTYENDCSGVYVRNDGLYAQAERLLDILPVRGVVYHVIKGQIEYDFEMERMERLFGERHLPVFRLETDYHDNDVEQLRIRLEAFAELLSQD